MIMPKPWPIGEIPNLEVIRFDFLPPTPKDNQWGVEITGIRNGLRFYVTFSDGTYHWLEEKIRHYLKGLI